MHHPILVYGLSGYGLFVAAALYLWHRLSRKNAQAPAVQTRFDELLHAEQVLKHAYEYLEQRGYSSVGGLLLQKRRDVVDAMYALCYTPQEVEERAARDRAVDEVLGATDCTRQAPHLCTVNGPCNGFPVGEGLNGRMPTVL